MRGAILSPPVAEPDLLEAAARTLDAVPGAEAVLLYGSRARGSAMPDSDWDVAVVTREEFFLPDQYGRTPIEALHPSVNAIFLGTDLLRHKRNSPGHIAREVLRDGRLLAGRMPRVGRIKKNPPMEHQEFVAQILGRRYRPLQCRHCIRTRTCRNADPRLGRSSPGFCAKCGKRR